MGCVAVVRKDVVPVKLGFRWGAALPLKNGCITSPLQKLQLTATAGKCIKHVENNQAFPEAFTVLAHNRGKLPVVANIGRLAGCCERLVSVAGPGKPEGGP